MISTTAGDILMLTHFHYLKFRCYWDLYLSYVLSGIFRRGIELREHREAMLQVWTGRP